ncbi:hypothetical protein ACEPAG_9534 [Sanghuangporus baumii]
MLGSEVEDENVSVGSDVEDENVSVDSDVVDENVSVGSDEESKEQARVQEDVWNHLRTGISYKSSSDAKLASLYIENKNVFPVNMFAKIFNVLQDPTFKLEDVTFKNLQDVFEYISQSRGRAVELNVDEKDSLSQPQPSSVEQSVPTAVVRLVVDGMLKDQQPLGVAAMEQRWKDAYDTNVSDFHAMSLVHRSWTPFARCGLRFRAVVPFNQMDKFLLSPWCGPWVREMIFYWDVRTDKKGATGGDITLFEALLKRLPNLHSLAFNTCHVWPKADLYYGGMYEEEGEQPPFHVDKCLELIADLLPNLENLWLKHFRGELRTVEMVKKNCPVTIDRTLQFCPEIPSLLRQLSKMHSLKLLSMRRWTHANKLEWKEAPTAALKTIELANLEKDAKSIRWLLGPRGEYRPTTISLDLRDYTPKFQDIAALSCEVEKLQIFSDDPPSCSAILSRCEKLSRLDLLLSYDSYTRMLEDIELPSTLECLGIHFHGYALHNVLSSSSSRRANIIKKHIESLPRLRILVLTEDPRDQNGDGELDGFIFYMALHTDIFDKIPKVLVKLCEARGIELIIQYATCTPACDRNFLRYGEPKPDKNPNEENRRMANAMANVMFGPLSHEI